MLRSRSNVFRTTCIALAYLFYVDLLLAPVLPALQARAAGGGEPEAVDGPRPASLSRDLHVDVGDATCGGNTPCFPTIQAAIDTADGGDRVLVRPGHYAEQLLILDKNGDEGASEADRIVIEADPSFAAGGVVIGPEQGGCPTSFAVLIDRSRFVTLRGLVFRNAGRRGIYLRGRRPQANHGIHLIQNRIFADLDPRCSGGVTISHENHETVVANNVIHGTRRDGIRVTDNGSGRHFIVSNTLVGNGHTGIYVARGHTAYLLNNIVLTNGAGRSLRRYGIRQGNKAPRTDDLHVRGNLVCGNTRGELKKIVLGADDTGNLTPTGTEGSGVAASPGCDDPGVVFANLAGLDGILNSLDDDFRLANQSPAIDAGVALLAAVPDVPAALLTADHFGPAARPADGDGDQRADYDIGAIEEGEPGEPTPTPDPTSTPIPSATPTPTPTASATPTPSASPSSSLATSDPPYPPPTTTTV